VRSNVTLNLGLRYSPETNPLAIGGVQEFVNMPLSPSYNPNLPMPGCATPTSCPALAAGTLPMTLMSHVYPSNPTLRNFEPRVGIAWDPFKDQFLPAGPASWRRVGRLFDYSRRSVARYAHGPRAQR
jgi:hypothetical protein